MTMTQQTRTHASPPHSNNHLSDRRLDASDKLPEHLFDAFAMKPGIPTVMIMGCIVMSVVWILLLRTFAKTIVFTSEAVKVCAMLYLGVKAGAFWFVLAFSYCVYVFCARKKLLFAAKIISHAATGLKENPQMFIALFIVKAVYVVQALLYIKFFEASVKVKTVDLSIELTESYDTNADMVCTTGADYSCAWEDWISEDDDVANNHCYAHDGYCDYPAISLGMVGVCDIVEPSWVSNGRGYIMLVWLWSVMFFTQFRLAIVACVIGSWHWHPDNKPSPMQALSTTATKSFGTVSYSGLICAMVEQFFKWSKLRWYHFIPPYLFIVGPLKITLCILGWCFKSCLQMLTKFSLVLHVFTGDTFFGSAKKCFGIMKRHFVGGFITEASSKNIMTIFAYVMAVAFCFSTWAWVDDEFDMVTIPGSTDDLWWILWTMLAAFCIYYPVLGLFFLVVLNGWMAEWSKAERDWDWEERKKKRSFGFLLSVPPSSDASSNSSLITWEASFSTASTSCSCVLPSTRITTSTSARARSPPSASTSLALSPPPIHCKNPRTLCWLRRLSNLVSLSLPLALACPKGKSSPLECPSLEASR